MESKIVGTVMPVLELSMQPGDKVFAESGELSWMSMAIQMQTGTSVGGQQGGLLGAVGRAMAGGTLFMTEYAAAGGPGLLAFAAKLPGQIVPLEIAPGHGYMVHRHGSCAPRSACSSRSRSSSDSARVCSAAPDFGCSGSPVRDGRGWSCTAKWSSTTCSRATPYGCTRDRS